MELNDLLQDFVSFLGTEQKKKTTRKRPLVKQLTYKGITKKWKFNGIELDIVGGKSYDWNFLKEDYETIEVFIKHLIDEEIIK